MDKLIGVYGASGFGREVMPILHEQISASTQLPKLIRIVFVDDRSDFISNVNGYDVMSFDNFCLDKTETKQICIAIGKSASRKLIHERIRRQDITSISVTALNSVQLQSVEIGEGAILCPFTTITSNVRIGKCFHANIYSYVGHDCSIGDFVTFAPGVKCNGNIIIEDDVYIGTGAIIKQGTANKPIIIGMGSKIEAGSYVTKSVEANTTVFGNPAVKMTLSNLRKLRAAH